MLFKQSVMAAVLFYKMRSKFCTDMLKICQDQFSMLNHQYIGNFCQLIVDKQTNEEPGSSENQFE